MNRISVLLWSFMLCGFFVAPLTIAQKEKPKGEQASEISELVGNWSGESVCVNKEKFPACNDEQVVYRIVVATGKSDTVFAWQLGSLPADTLRLVRGSAWALSVCFAAVTVLSWMYFFPIPIAFSGVITVCLIVAARRSGKAMIKDE